jgi:hypothetical protein
VGNPPEIRSVDFANGGLQLRVDGFAQSNQLVIEASTNLGTWFPIYTNATPTYRVFYTDTAVGGLPTRFYRAVLSP